MQGMSNMLGQQTLGLGASATESDVFRASKYGPLAALLMPAAFTAESVTFEGAVVFNGTYYTLYKDGAVYSVDVAVDSWVVLDPTVFYATPFVKIVIDSSEGTAREIIVIGRHTS